MIKTYAKGRRKEYKIIQEERDKGRIAFRSAGSHSPIDVVSIDIENRNIFLIQSKMDIYKKNGQLRKSFQDLMDKEIRFDGVYDVRFIVR